MRDTLKAEYSAHGKRLAEAAKAKTQTEEEREKQQAKREAVEWEDTRMRQMHTATALIQSNIKMHEHQHEAFLPLQHALYHIQRGGVQELFNVDMYGKNPFFNGVSLLPGTYKFGEKRIHPKYAEIEAAYLKAVAEAKRLFEKSKQGKQ